MLSHMSPGSCALHRGSLAVMALGNPDSHYGRERRAALRSWVWRCVNHAFRLPGDWSTGEEVVSLTFLEAWRLRVKVEPDGAPVCPAARHRQQRDPQRFSGDRRRQAAAGRLPLPPSVPDVAEEVAGRIDDAANGPRPSSGKGCQTTRDAKTWTSPCGPAAPAPPPRTTTAPPSGQPAQPARSAQRSADTPPPAAPPAQQRAEQTLIRGRHTRRTGHTWQ